MLTVISHLTKQYAALRSTFHPPTGACDSTESYVAVHEAETSPPSIEVIVDENGLEQVLHRGFNLFEEFPVRWVILQKILVSASASKTSTTLFVVGHHLALDGVSALFTLDQQLLISLLDQHESSFERHSKMLRERA